MGDRMVAPEVKAFVIGDPIAHSRSPLIHGCWIDQLGVNGSYDRIHVKPGDLRDFLQNFQAAGFVGGNVTVPHKEAAFSYCVTTKNARLTDRALAIGAVNTLFYEGDILVGDNTDSFGFAANLDSARPNWDKALDHAVVVGAGGASRAVVYALKERGAKTITIANRTLSRAEELVKSMDLENAKTISLDILSEVLPTADLLVNTSAGGMDGKGSLTLDLSSLSSDCFVTDIVYSPLITSLLAAAKRRGCPIADGLGMLLHQARPGFEKWFGHQPQVTAELRQIVLADLDSQER